MKFYFCYSQVTGENSLVAQILTIISSFYWFNFFYKTQSNFKISSVTKIQTFFHAFLPRNLMIDSAKLIFNLCRNNFPRPLPGVFFGNFFFLGLFLDRTFHFSKVPSSSVLSLAVTSASSSSRGGGIVLTRPPAESNKKRIYIQF